MNLNLVRDGWWPEGKKDDILALALIVLDPIVFRKIDVTFAVPLAHSSLLSCQKVALTMGSRSTNVTTVALEMQQLKEKIVAWCWHYRGVKTWGDVRERVVPEEVDKHFELGRRLRKHLYRVFDEFNLPTLEEEVAAVYQEAMLLQNWLVSLVLAVSQLTSSAGDASMYSKRIWIEKSAWGRWRNMQGNTESWIESNIERCIEYVLFYLIHPKSDLGRESHIEVTEDEAPLFANDPWKGCTPPLCLVTSGSNKHYNFPYYVILEGKHVGIYIDWDLADGFKDPKTVISGCRGRSSVADQHYLVSVGGKQLIFSDR
ncbi:hypothetical protein C8J56DRAFT_902718 [Mycena floridula]|nr:hypothetical protein C8J56DRAFT_902718 [Mycena floridula]